MAFDDYERLESGSVRVHMMAGAAAGIMEHCVMYPLDSVKTRMQSLSPAPGGEVRGVRDGLRRMVEAEGIFRPVRGMSAVVVGAGPAHALYFAAYEATKERLLQKLPANQAPLAHGAAGCVATVFHDGVMTPAEVVKQRMQMFGSPYTSVIQCIKRVWVSEGSRAFFRSYTTQLAMNGPFQAIHFVVYEAAAGVSNPGGRYNPPAHMVSGALAGAVAAAVTTPLDVCKTLLNTQEGRALSATGAARVVGIRQALRTILTVGGPAGFFQGLSARVLYQMPSTAICWSVYEFFKYYLDA